jgi:hypothetical protein
MQAGTVGLAVIAVMFLVVVALDRRERNAAVDTFNPVYADLAPIVAFGLAGVFVAVLVGVLSETTLSYTLYVDNQNDDFGFGGDFDFDVEPELPGKVLPVRPAVLMDACRIEQMSVVPPSPSQLFSKLEAGVEYAVRLAYSIPVHPNTRSPRDIECPVVASLKNDTYETDFIIGGEIQRVDLASSEPPHWVVQLPHSGYESLVLEVVPAGSCSTPCSPTTSTIFELAISENRGVTRASAALEKLSSDTRVSIEAEPSIQPDAPKDVTLAVHLPTNVNLRDIDDLTVSLTSNSQDLAVSKSAFEISQDDLGHNLIFDAVVTARSDGDLDALVELDFEGRRAGETLSAEESATLEVDVREKSTLARYSEKANPTLGMVTGVLTVLGALSGAVVWVKGRLKRRAGAGRDLSGPGPDPRGYL